MELLFHISFGLGKGKYFISKNSHLKILFTTFFLENYPRSNLHMPTREYVICCECR